MADMAQDQELLVRKIRVGVVGAKGKMGQQVCRVIQSHDALELAAQVDIDDPLIKLTDNDCQVVVDFTVASAARQTLKFLAQNAIHAVVGTSGLSKEDECHFREVFTKSNCLIAPNFALGAVLMMRFAKEAAHYFLDADVIEYHHDAKVDSPSSTAIHTAELIDAVATKHKHFSPDPTQNEVLPGARGGLVGQNVRVHAIRSAGVIANHEVSLGHIGQTLTIRHEIIDRSCFMPGVILACRRIDLLDQRLTLGLDALIDQFGINALLDL